MSERAEIPERFRWNLDDLYPSVEAWQAAREKVEAALPALRAFEAGWASPPRAGRCARDRKRRAAGTLSRRGVCEPAGR
jgi:oligoendopeptidase F